MSSVPRRWSRSARRWQAHALRRKTPGLGRCRWSRLPRRLSATRFTGVSMALIGVLSKLLANILVADFRGKWAVRFLASCVLVCCPGPRGAVVGGAVLDLLAG